MTTAKNEFKGHHLAIILVCFFGVIVSVNFSMAYIARSNWTGLVVKNSYVASQYFNDELEAAKRQSKAGWSSVFAYQQGKLQIALKGPKGAPLPAQNVTANIGRPAFEKQDHQVELVAKGKGQFEVENPLAPGLWKITFKANVSGLPYRRDVRLLVTKNGRGLIQ